MIRKTHNHTPQTNPQHREEEPQNNNSHKTPGKQKSKTTSSLFPIKMIAKLEKETKHRTTKDGSENSHNGSNNKQ